MGFAHLDVIPKYFVVIDFEALDPRALLFDALELADPALGVAAGGDDGVHLGDGSGADDAPRQIVVATQIVRGAEQCWGLVVDVLFDESQHICCQWVCGCGAAVLVVRCEQVCGCVGGSTQKTARVRDRRHTPERIAQTHHIAWGRDADPLYHAVHGALHVADLLEGVTYGVPAQGVADVRCDGIEALVDRRDIEERLGHPAPQQARSHGGTGLIQHAYQRPGTVVHAVEELEIAAGLRIEEHHRARGIRVDGM